MSPKEIQMPELLTEKEASRLVGLSTSWFQQRRWRGGGPPYIKINRMVRYQREDLVHWFESQPAFTMTCQYKR